MATKAPYIIINGPGRAQLFQSLERSYSDARTYVCFSLPDKTNLRGRITSLGYEDGSGHRFAFRGWFNGAKYQGSYDAYTRKGTISPV